MSNVRNPRDMRRPGLRCIEFRGPVGRDPDRAAQVVRAILQEAARPGADLRLASIRIEPDCLQVEVDLPPAVVEPGDERVFLKSVGQIVGAAIERVTPALVRGL